MSYQDFPFDDVAKRMMELAAKGIDTYQKFTCSGCGQRLTMDVPNHLYEQGTCDKCPAITDIKKQGCNFLIHARLK